MDWITLMDDTQLATTIARLKRDIDRFREKAAVVARDIAAEGRPWQEDSLYRRLSGIAEHLCAQLRAAETERTRRDTQRATAQTRMARWARAGWPRIPRLFPRRR